MKEMFEFPLRRTYELLLEQLRQARRNGSVDIKVCTSPLNRAVMQCEQEVHLRSDVVAVAAVIFG
jgi:hypothetical protein